MKLPPPIARLLGRLPVRTVLHPIQGVFAWARTLDLPLTAPSLESGVDGGIEEARGRVDVVVHVPEIRISRLDLPSVGTREARQIASRRREDLLGDEPDAMHVSSLICRTPAGSVLWLVSAPKEVCAEVDAELETRKIWADRLLPLSLALGGVARLLPPPIEEGLTAILWVESEWSHCVVADAHGWRFDRQIALKLGFEGPIGEAAANSVAWQEEEHQFVEHVTVELERTFTYVERHLSLGKVTRICLCGPLPGLESLANALVANQSLEVSRVGETRMQRFGPRSPPAAAAALGAVALGGSVSDASLLTDALAAPRHRIRARRRLTGLAIASCLFALLGFAYQVWGAAAIASAASRVQAEAERWNSERESLARLAAERERAQRVLDTDAALSRPEPPWSSLLVVLGGLMPEHLFVQRLEIVREAEGWRMELWLDAEGSSEGETADAVTALRGRIAALSLFRVMDLEVEPAVGAESDRRFRIAAWVAAVADGASDGG